VTLLVTKNGLPNPKITDSTTLCGRTQQEMFEFCRQHTFPGSRKYVPEHPIWLGSYGSKGVTPPDGWNNDVMLRKAISNLFYITTQSEMRGKYPEFVKDVKKSVIGWGQELLWNIQKRFTIVKIAPKVSALQESMFLNIIEEEGIDLSKGVYCPMAGFGGIIRGCTKWFENRGLEPNIEAYDINPEICKWYGWVQKDVLSQKIKTDKVVVACPPFGEDGERWKGTPGNMYIGYDNWVKKIVEMIDAPNYIFFGPSINERPGINGLFSKKYGISLDKRYLRTDPW